MRVAGLSNAAIAAFKKNYDQLVAGVTGMVNMSPYLIQFEFYLKVILSPFVSSSDAPWRRAVNTAPRRRGVSARHLAQLTS